MRITVLYFALLRERLRASEETVELPAGSTALSLLDALSARHEVIAALRGCLRVAINHSFAPLEQPLSAGDEVALIPPVSGGATPCRLSHEPLLLQEVVDAVSGPGRGGIVTFTGAVRDHSRGKNIVRLEYEAYEPMALRTMGLLIESIEATQPGVRLAMVHRLGTLTIGDLAVVIAAAAPHRAEAFTACQAAIDRLKEEVPIWKKEVAADGATWIGERP